MDTIVVALISTFAPVMMAWVGFQNRDKRDIELRKIAQSLQMTTEMIAIDERRKERVRKRLNKRMVFSWTEVARFYALTLFAIGLSILLIAFVQGIFQKNPDAVTLGIATVVAAVAFAIAALIPWAWAKFAPLDWQRELAEVPDRIKQFRSISKTPKP